MFEQIENYLKNNMKKFHIPSLSIAIVKNDKIIYSKGYGYANIEEKIPADSNTIYRVASMTKQIIATSLLQFYEKGYFKLEDNVNNVLDDVKLESKFKELPTMRSLFTHTSGLPAHVPPIYHKKENLITIKKLISTYNKVIHPPDKIWIYSNTAYNIMGYLVGIFSGTPYPEYVKKNLFNPLEMEDSFFEFNNMRKNDIANLYHWNSAIEKHEKIEPYNVGGIPESSSSALYTTAIDYAKFLIAHLNDGMYKGNSILKKSTVKKMQKTHWSLEGSPDGMSLSWMVNHQYGLKGLWQHGSMPGVGNIEIIYPDEKMALVILTNVSGNPDWRFLISGAIQRMLLNRYEPFSLNKIKQKQIPKNWENIEGKYGIPSREEIIKIENDYLILENRGDKIYLEKLDEYRYQIHGGSRDGALIIFNLNEKEDVIGFSIGTRTVKKTISDLILDEDINLSGSWYGGFYNWLHPFILKLDIKDNKNAVINDMKGNIIKITEFQASKGRITGKFQCEVLPEYSGWIHANSMDLELMLYAIEDQLKGHVLGRSIVPITLTRE
jgi:CubicO group peptidase (beta-lactamase class C family)